jgi:hypothetical protein
VTNTRVAVVSKDTAPSQENIGCQDCQHPVQVAVMLVCMGLPVMHSPHTPNYLQREGLPRRR